MTKWNTILASTVALSMVVAVGCGDNDEDTVANAPAAETAAPPVAGQTNAPAAEPAAEGEVTVADIAGSPERYIDKTVTVEADVEEVLSSFAFALDEDSPVSGGIDNDLVVFSPKSSGLSDIDDQWLNNKVRVTGRVVQMNVVEIEREIGWDLDRKIEVEFEKPRPVIIAQSVERTQQ